MIGRFFTRNWPYMVMLFFIAFVTIVMFHVQGKGVPAAVQAGEAETAQAAGSYDYSAGKIAEREEAVIRMFYENRPLYIAILLTNLAILVAIGLGFFLDGYILRRRIKGSFVIEKTLPAGEVRWGMPDVARFVIMFYAFGYFFVILESVLSDAFPVLNSRNFRMIFNTTVLDTAAIIFVLNFVVLIHRQKLASIGLTLKNFTKNVFYGVSGYIAIIPPLVIVLMLVYVVVTVFKLRPPVQPIVDLLMKEEKVPVLVYSSVFAGILGPIAEEIFFRGFMYNAAKKRVGVFWSIMITAALFATLHANLAGFAPIFVLGVALTYLYEKTGSLVPSMMLHITHNLAMVFLVFLFKSLGV